MFTVEDKVHSVYSIKSEMTDSQIDLKNMHDKFRYSKLHLYLLIDLSSDNCFLTQDIP